MINHQLALNLALIIAYISLKVNLILVLALVFIEIVLVFLLVPLGTAPNQLDLIGTNTQ